jgi:(S)-3,5-dihydroxyphenylglycine transaminase
VVAVETQDGFRCADLDLAINRRARGHPRFYVVPDHSIQPGPRCRWNPAANSWTWPRVADILIVEDSPYRMVSPEPHLPTLKSLDRGTR